MNFTSNSTNSGLNVTALPITPYKYGTWILTEVVMILSTIIYCYVLFRLVMDEISRGTVSRQFEGERFVQVNRQLLRVHYTEN